MRRPKANLKRSYLVILRVGMGAIDFQLIIVVRPKLS